MRYRTLAYYVFTAIEDPRSEIRKHKKYFENRDVAGRIYISEEGINGQMSGSEEDALAYMEWFHTDPRFAHVPFKLHPTDENVFPRMAIKYRKQLVALDVPVDATKTARHLSPKEWRDVLESDEEYVLLDVRNDYEWKIGHFEGSTLPPLKKFRDFPAYADKLKETLKPNTKVLMCCTGGIRCELYSVLLKERGFTDVNQLEGGILGYGLKEGSAHWKGKCFVFDDRLAIPLSDKQVDPIATCSHCDTPSDTYYNCANMDCNELFLACPTCIAKLSGCCSDACTHSDHVRAFNASRGNKPFRRKHLEGQVPAAPSPL